ncbi:hypothetical protein IBX65_01390, partial [Candidatus Aerophobetes bacterium]|nr:hypothetical protein [Candidatus Aerophobetes bacterium]
EASFKLSYLYPEEATVLISPYLSAQGTIDVDVEKEVVKVQDASYQLFQIASLIEKKDTFSPQRKLFRLSYVSVRILSYSAKELLSEKGELNIDEPSNSLIVVDAKKFLDRVDYLVQKEDRIENQLITKKYNLLYLSAQEAKVILEPIISQHGKIMILSFPQEIKEKKEDVISIPQKTSSDTCEEKETTSRLSSMLQSVIYVSDLEKNFAEIEKIIQELNSPVWASKMITRTFYIEDGSVERIALTIANAIGVPAEHIEGLQLKTGTWMQMQLSSPTIDLGNIGAIGKK